MGDDGGDGDDGADGDDADYNNKYLSKLTDVPEMPVCT